ncbi:O-antigen ligase family protein [Bradyrhizobium vignae]|uniref:O-antigen ligase family protein n=1 Tax=Bradyrhizobium vignae TaxID=1549949 RepID=A0ABS3ZQC8_9BRAD|nr:O-antigen ligase family protein [Bradyrhizobium vignae]MBP0110351.1 O-antigen ligase family protein [Bradyrhizobium vignae]
MALVLLVALIMGGTAYRYSFAIPGLLLPVLFMRRTDLAFLSGLAVFFVLKIAASMLVEPGSEYGFYSLDYQWIARETGTICLFFFWLLMGERVLPLRRLTSLSWKVHAGALIILFCLFYSYFGRIEIGTIDNLSALVLLLIYVLIIGPYGAAIRLCAVTVLVLTVLIPLESSFAIISCFILLGIYGFVLVGHQRLRLPWRLLTSMSIVVLVVMSQFAYLIDVRPVRSTGEGNNGYIRAALAEAGYREIKDRPILGSPMGRGILPISIINELKWEQYFEPGSGYDVFALSFHNSFIYLLARYGICSFFLFFLLLKRIPRSGPAHAVLFTMTLVLGMGANVVIESLRSGPGVAFALGTLVATARPQRRLAS